MTVALYPKKKVEIVVDAAATDEVVAIVERAGAKGYTIVPGVTGKGVRGVRSGHDVFEGGPNALVVVIAPEAVADRIVAGVRELLGTWAGILYVSDVKVARDDHF